MANMAKCHYCGKYFPEKAMVIDHCGNYYCEDCAAELLEECPCCGELARRDSFTTVHLSDSVYRRTEQWCSECVGNYAFRCTNCGNWYDNRNCDLYELPSGDVICTWCYDNNYVTCEECGDVISRDVAIERDGYYYCEDCAPAEVIHSYHGYSTDWHCHGEDPSLCSSDELKFPLIGWELEIDGGGENDDNAVEITAAMGWAADESDMLKCSHDGSLDDGFEIISQPCTLEFHLGRSKYR